LDVVNIHEELGDLRFYIQMMFNEDPLPSGPYSFIEEPSKDFEAAIFEMALRLKDAIDNCDASKLLQTFYSMCHVMGFDEIAVMNENMAKLRKRYPDGYSDQNAAARLDKAE
jgi:hypothetical protein